MLIWSEVKFAGTEDANTGVYVVTLMRRHERSGRQNIPPAVGHVTKGDKLDSVFLGVHISAGELRVYRKRVGDVVNNSAC